MNNLKKLLFVSLNDHVTWGGSEVLWSKTALHLKDRAEVSVFYKKWKEEPEQLKILKSEGIKILYKNNKTPENRNSLLTKVKRKISVTQNKKEHLTTLNNIQHFNMVVISVGDHVDVNIISYTNYLITHAIPYVIIVQLATDLRYVSDSVIEQLTRAYKHAKKVFFVSIENAQKTEIQFGTLLDNKIIINNPFFYKQQYVPIKTKEFSLACVAAFTSFHKGQDVLIHVLSQEKWRRRDLVLNLYGNGINKQQLERLIELYSLEGKVIIRGYENDKAEIWKENMACIMPSRMEGQSLAMLEAMSHGRMIISTKVGDAERLVINNETGFLIDAPTIELIDKTLEEAWHKRADWEKMGVLSRQHLFRIITKDPIFDLSEQLEKLV